MESTFILWQPTLEENNQGCYFDVQPDDFVQLNEGSQELLQLFLKDLGIVAIVEFWKIESFCSPYYARTHISHWRDQYPMAWRVFVKFRGEGKLIDPISFQPYVSSGLDPTWQEKEDSWNWFEKDCVVIVDFFSEDKEKFVRFVNQNIVDESYRGLNFYKLDDDFTQARFELGKILFPEESGKVENMIKITKNFVPSAHWATTLRMSEQLINKNMNRDQNWKKLLD